MKKGGSHTCKAIWGPLQVFLEHNMKEGEISEAFSWAHAV